MISFHKGKLWILVLWSSAYGTGLTLRQLRYHTFELKTRTVMGNQTIPFAFHSSQDGPNSIPLLFLQQLLPFHTDINPRCNEMWNDYDYVGTIVVGCLRHMVHLLFAANKPIVPTYSPKNYSIQALMGICIKAWKKVCTLYVLMLDDASTIVYSKHLLN